MRTRKRPSGHLRTLQDGRKIPINPHIQKKRKLHIISFSGGKDSSAMLLRMIELNMPIDRILFADTGKEFPKLYEFIKRMDRYTRREIGVPVETLTTHDHWDNWFYGEITRGERKGMKRGFPLMAFHCWWSREAKFKMLEPECAGNYRYIGFGFDETNRVNKSRGKPGYRFPLADWGWTEAKALEYLEWRGFAEQFHRDFGRTGCTCCPKQHEDSLRTLARKYPRQWKELMKYAKDCQHPSFASHKFNIQTSYNDLLRIEREEGR